jgi:predicted PurR-regulated permease PerM
MVRKVEISHKTIVFAVFFLISLWFLYFIRDLILQLFVALLLMTILNSAVAKLSQKHVPRILSVAITYILVLAVFGLAIGGLIPPLVDQTTNFANNLPAYLSNLGISRLVSEQITTQLITQLGSLPGQVVKVGTLVFSNILSVVAVLIFTFYLLLIREKLDDFLGFFFGEEKVKEIARFFDKLELRLGGWVRGEIILMILVGLLNFIGLTLLGIPFALPLAILAGLLEIIPMLGPFFAAIPAVIIALSISPIMAVAVAALAFFVQQLENYVFVPKVMEKSVGVNPLITLIALSIGFKLLGVVGAIISVPIVITLHVLLLDRLQEK